MPSLRASLSRSRSAPRALDKQHQQRASPFKYAASRFRNVAAKANGSKSAQTRRQPPLKRRRMLNHSSESDDEETDGSSRVIDDRASSASISDDNVRDSDYVTEEDEQEDENDQTGEDELDSDQPTPRAASRYASMVDMSEDDDENAALQDGNTSSSSSSSSLKALSPIAVNVGALRGRETLGGGKTGRKHVAETLHKRRQQNARSAALQRNIVPVVTSKLTRFPPSPVKLLPSNGKRGFHVRPDAPQRSNPFAYAGNDSRARDVSSATRASSRTDTRATFQTGIRRIAGQVINRVNGSMGLSGHSRSSATAQVPATSAQRSNSLSTSVNGKRKRGDHAAVSNNHESSGSLRRSCTLTDLAHEPDFAAFQPIRRTRSLARQIEQLGLPVSQAYDGEDAEEPIASTSSYVRVSRRNSATIEESAEEDDDTDSVERSIADMSLDEITENEEADEPAVEEEEDEEDQDLEADNSDDTYFLREASLPQLHRLRKDKLLHLVSLLQHEDDEQDQTDYTKDMLVKLILNNRDLLDNTQDAEEDDAASSADASDEDVGDDAEGSEQEAASSDEASVDEEENSPDMVVRPVLGSRQLKRRSSTKKSKSAASSAGKTEASRPASASPRTRQQRRNSARSVASSHLFDSSSSPSSSDDGEPEHASSQPASSPRHSGARRSCSGSARHDGVKILGHGRSSYGTEKTPGRLRSGKLRHPSTAPATSSDAEKENRFSKGPYSHDGGKRSTAMMMRRSVSQASLSDDAEEFDSPEDDAEVPTPIACRTRHRRNVSAVSASSSVDGYGDDEEVAPNREYRLRKISLPKRTTAKRTGLLEHSEDDEDEVGDESEEVEQEAEEVDEEGTSVVEYDEDDGDVEDENQEIDLAQATRSGLLRLRRDVLIDLCQQRELEETGTKSDLVARLLEWQAENGVQEDEDADQSTEIVATSDDEDDDEDFEPAADVSMAISEADVTNDTMSSSSSSSGRSNATARRETKTQAFAKLSNKQQSWDAASQDKPLLLKSPKSKADLIHSPKPDTPGPRSGDSHDNDLELDLESLNLLDKEIHPDKLKKGEKIGSGGFKDVYEGRYRNVKVALADIRGHLTENDLKELGLLRDLRHDNIVRFIGVSIPTSREVPVTIVSELCSNGDLFDYVRNTSAPPLEKVLSIMLNIARGLEYLHKRKPAIIHRDMKSSNVLITAKGVAKISDFGLARVRNSTRSIIKSLVGTVNWQAPELWVPHPRYNEKVDVYSAGMVFWECLQWHLSQKRYPFEGMNEHAIYQEVGQKQMRPSTATMRRQWGGEILDLVEKMWAQNPQHRPTMLEVVRELELLLQVERTKARATSSR